MNLIRQALIKPTQQCTATSEIDAVVYDISIQLWWCLLQCREDSIPVKAAIYSKATIALFKMQAGKIRKVLGFTNRRRADEPGFVFIGVKAMLGACLQIACRNGLKDVAYIEGSSTELPKGHLESINDVQTSERVYMVYDVNSYSYQDVFEVFSISPSPNVFIGTYDEFTGIVITPHEIYR